ncbi:dihydrofolate reductase [Desulfonema ishimotonii]|uniref:Dihydrofolate reductase n=1 Tax=Desulfonema ishimotonii TaxID=45657 RepID=A0A401FVW0_9BACT|nr:dihydrofolate reductase family protein [Desulfonema ishimotonii]GBC61100.1 dihydrofolate reductase [Desulfonema ishimotonii]
MKVILLMATTLDGKIGKSPDHFPDWTGKADKKLFVEITKRAGVVIMGSKTFDTIGKPLPDRKNIILTRNKKRISEWENLVFTDESPGAVLEHLAAEGFSEVVLAGGAMVNSLFAEAGLIDEIIVTISPKIFGFGLSLFTQEISMELVLKDVRRLGENLVCLTYSVVNAPLLNHRFGRGFFQVGA